MGNRHSAPPSSEPEPEPETNPTIPGDLRLPNFFVEAIIALYKETAQGGGIQIEDFISMFKGKLELSNDLKQFLESLFRAYDKDGNRTMDITELLQMLDEVLCGDPPEKVSGIFKMCDFDGDGFITRKELRQFMSSLAWKLQEGETPEQRKQKLLTLADDIFLTFDTDGDEKLTMVEFQDGCQQHPEMKNTVQGVIDICVGKGI